MAEREQNNVKYEVHVPRHLQGNSELLFVGPAAQLSAAVRERKISLNIAVFRGGLSESCTWYNNWKHIFYFVYAIQLSRKMIILQERKNQIREGIYSTMKFESIMFELCNRCFI